MPTLAERKANALDLTDPPDKPKFDTVELWCIEDTKGNTYYRLGTTLGTALRFLPDRNQTLHRAFRVEFPLEDAFDQLPKSQQERLLRENFVPKAFPSLRHR